MFYPDDLVLMAETLDDLKKKLTIWKDYTERQKGCVNRNKKKPSMQQTQFISQVRSFKMTIQCLLQRCLK